MKRSNSKFLIAISVSIASAALLMGCGSKSSSSTTTTSTTTSTSVTPTTQAGSTSPVSVPAPPTAPSLLTGITTNSSSSGESVVFTFQNSVPGYKIEYATGPVMSDPQGEPMTIDGANALVVLMAMASGVDLTGPNYVPIYTGPNRFSPNDTSTVKEIVKVGDFEAVLTWAIGTSRQAPFTVSTTDKTLTITFAK